MVELTRTVRFSINPGEVTPDATPPHKNGFGGAPPMVGLGRYYEIDVCCEGEPEHRTGYLINIKEIDAGVREGLVPLIARACEASPRTEPAGMLPALLERAQAHLRVRVHRLTWRLTPTYSLTMDATKPDSVVLRQQFDIAAAHRLHAAELSDQENREVFGRCNNPSGHGHNYRIETAVRVDLDSGVRPAFTLPQLERIVDARIVQPFDHRHFNLDTEAFGSESGVIPSVENIARVFYDLLAPAIADESKGGATLETITVWETDRTRCTYPGERV